MATCFVGDFGGNTIRGISRVQDVGLSALEVMVLQFRAAEIRTYTAGFRLKGWRRPP